MNAVGLCPASLKSKNLSLIQLFVLHPVEQSQCTYLCSTLLARFLKKKVICSFQVIYLYSVIIQSTAQCSEYSVGHCFKKQYVVLGCDIEVIKLYFPDAQDKMHICIWLGVLSVLATHCILCTVQSLSPDEQQASTTAVCCLGKVCVCVGVRCWRTASLGAKP